MSQIKSVEFVNDRMSRLILGCHWYVVILNMYA